jgi:hypothetical protein
MAGQPNMPDVGHVQKSQREYLSAGLPEGI